MENELHSIGEMARASGLTVSALRFYDTAGVLTPAVVDPQTGYRWYAERQLGPARLVASLRRVGLPLARIAEVLASWPDQRTVRRLLDAHLHRLEAGLADARRELSRVHALLDNEEIPMTITTVTLAAADLAAALDAVRFAVSRDPELPMLGGVLFEVDGGPLRLVATDRYRMALSRAVVVSADGPPVAVLAPTGFVDELRRMLPVGSNSPAGATAGGPVGTEVTLSLGTDSISVRSGDREVTGRPVAGDFPDYRRLLGERCTADGLRQVPVDVAALRAALTTGPTSTVVREQDGVACAVSLLAVGPDGQLAVVGADATGGQLVGVNREFLLEALDAGGSGQLVLELDGPIRPLAVRLPDDEERFSILMPVRVNDI